MNPETKTAVRLLFALILLTWGAFLAGLYF